jgi:hypothetical protein
MKMNMKLATILGAAVLAATTAVAKPAANTLHFSIKTSLTDSGVEPGSAGSVSGTEVKQGTKLNQKLDVTVSGLTANTGYTLNGVTGGGTVDLQDFTTDDNGKATLHFRGGGKGTPKNTIALPDGFELGAVTEIDVVGGGGTVLSTADTTPQSVKYSIKKDISSSAASGTLQINASSKSTKFTLNGSGLSPNTDYNLFFNGAQVQTNTTDSKGRLKIKSAPTPTNILDLTTVEVQDTSGTPVLGTTLP